MFEKYVLFFNIDHADLLGTVDFITFLNNPLFCLRVKHSFMLSMLNLSNSYEIAYYTLIKYIFLILIYGSVNSVQLITLHLFGEMALGKALLISL